MASIEQLERALRNADAAGDANAAKTFANEIRRMRSVETAAPPDTTGRNSDGTYGQPPEGMTLNPKTGQMEDLRSPINPNIPQGGANALGIGVGQGTGFNLLDEASAALTVPFGGDYDYNLGRMREAERRASEDHPVAYYGGQVGGAVGTGVGLAKGGLSATSAAINSGARLPVVALASGAEGAALGAGYGFGAGEGGEGRKSGALTGGAIGGVVGLATPLAIAGASKAYQKIKTPFSASPERQAAASVLEAEGVPLTAGQRTGSKWLQYRESELGGGRAADLMEDQAKAFTDAAMRRAGGDGLATPENMRAMSDRLGKGFEEISARNSLKADGPFLKDMLTTLDEYNKVLPSEQKQILGSIASDIGERIQAGGGTMSGTDYQAIRSSLAKRAHNARNNPELAEAFRGLRNSLDSAMDRSIIPDDAGAWSELRRQYGNMKVLERASNGGGEAAGLGVISPARLRMAASSGNQGAYARGYGDFSELSKAGQALMTPLPNSGTAQRMAAQGVVAALLGGGGGMAAGPAGLALGLAGPAAAGRLLMSKPIQSYLANQAAQKTISPQTQAIINALLNSSGASSAARLAAP